MDLSIANIHGMEILDSRGSPTATMEVTPGDGTIGAARVPLSAMYRANIANGRIDGRKPGGTS